MTAMRSITLQECIDAWNEQADEWNQWGELDADERCEWCLTMAGAFFDELMGARCRKHDLGD